MKYLFILLFAAFGLTVSAQDMKPEVTQLMEQELKMIKKDLISQDKPEVLSAEQSTKLKELLMVKAEKINAVRQSDQNKLTMSQNLTKINEEFEPAILAVFSDEQKKAFKSSPRNKRRFMKNK